MKRLLYIEAFKLLRQSRTLYAVFALLIIESIVLFSAYFQGTEIIDIVLSNLKDTFYFQGNLLNGNLIIYFILNSFWFHVPLLIMIIVSGMLTTEYQEKTLQTVFMQPVVKWKYVLAKYIVASLFTVGIVFLLALTSILLSYGIFGKGDLIVYNNGLVFFEQSDAFLRLIYAFLFGTVTLLFFSTVSLTLAVVLKETFKTWIVSALFLIVSTLLLKVDLGNAVLNQITFFKLNNTWQYFFSREIDWETVIVNSVCIGFYSLFTVLLGLLLFQKKDIG